LKRAVEFHQGSKDVLDEANDMQSLGHLYFRRDKLDDPDKLLKPALALHHQLRSHNDEAADLSIK